ncbi:unnamed protein product [Didymodactylos carnosus]|uniref:Uncharacterized protein n=1 Tax=Didymodactylos carnosus TaxID=1234261 RepID=A0A813VX16_9BILA|nr:unnamed protein product [Didymodactylos carnosus]CAF0933188.1 unnamed protein product [Didymodactylos carnosus]CAF3636955.1 unnamed protein product [Didymodactylos carnosus]CAF3709278.1 unnamed protein product [Didymodactylos carnosus]
MSTSVINVKYSTPPQQRSSTLPSIATSSSSPSKFLPIIKGVTPTLKSRNPSSFPLSNLYVSLSSGADRLLNKIGKNFSIKKNQTSPPTSINRLMPPATPTLVRRSSTRSLFINEQDAPFSYAKGSVKSTKITSPMRPFSYIETRTMKITPPQCLFFTKPTTASTSKSNSPIMMNQSFSLSKFKKVLLKRRNSSIIVHDHSFKASISSPSVKHRLKYLLVKRQELKHSIDNLCQKRTKLKHILINKETPLNAIMFTTTLDIYLFQPKLFYKIDDDEKEILSQHKFTYLSLADKYMILTAKNERINLNQFQIGFCSQTHTTIQIQPKLIHYFISYTNIMKNIKNPKFIPRDHDDLSLITQSTSKSSSESAFVLKFAWLFLGNFLKLL